MGILHTTSNALLRYTRSARTSRKGKSKTREMEHNPEPRHGVQIKACFQGKACERVGGVAEGLDTACGLCAPAEKARLTRDDGGSSAG